MRAGVSCVMLSSEQAFGHQEWSVNAESEGHAEWSAVTESEGQFRNNSDTPFRYNRRTARLQ